MAELLTPTVNVPAERAKLRTLRDQINANAQERLAHQRNYTARGFLRDMRPLELAGQQADGAASLRTVCTSPAVGVLPAAPDLREAPARCTGCGRCACGVAGEGLTQ